MSRPEFSKTITLAAAVATVFAAGAATAGSPMPYYEEPVPYIPVAPAPTWEGFYFGGIGGIQTGDLTETVTNTTLPFDATTYGGMAGYNVQRDQFVFGAEVDVQFGSASSDIPRQLQLNQFGPVDLDVNYLIDLRGRAGMAFDNVLVYVAGGYTTTKISETTAGPLELKASGWNVGAGIDLAVSEDFFVGGEYIYRDLSGDDNLSNPWDLNTHGFQLRAAYRF